LAVVVSGLFFLGHMSWAVVWATLFAKGTKTREKLFFPAILMLGVLPDFDLFLGGYGVEHHSFFHSILFWVALFLPALIVFRWRVVPYLVAVLQHFAFGDFLVGEVMLFWPFDLSLFGFNSPMFSVFDVFLEIVGLLLAFLVLYFSGNLKRLVSVRLDNVLIFVPLFALVSSMLYFAVDWPIVPLIYYIGSSPILTTVVIGHLVIVGFFVVSVFQGLRSLRFG
jgi:hypothetical protein